MRGAKRARISADVACPIAVKATATIDGATTLTIITGTITAATIATTTMTSAHSWVVLLPAQSLADCRASQDTGAARELSQVARMCAGVTPVTGPIEPPTTRFSPIAVSEGSAIHPTEPSLTFAAPAWRYSVKAAISGVGNPPGPIVRTAMDQRDNGCAISEPSTISAFCSIVLQAFPKWSRGCGSGGCICRRGGDVSSVSRSAYPACSPGASAVAAVPSIRVGQTPLMLNNPVSRPAVRG